MAASLSALSLNAVITPPANADTPPPSSAAPSSGKADQLPLDEAHASLKAQATGKPVAVEAATTSTDREVANPDGTFTLTQSLAPVRKYTGGKWQALDATLVRHADGTVTPAVSTSALTLSGGGSGPLAQMDDHGKSLTLSLPASLGSLPAPTLDGPTATYANVLPAVDLKVTADAQGGFSEVLVVKNARAAANPALAALDFPTRAHGVALSADAAGNIRAKDTTGRTVFSAPAPLMWDSATTAPKTAARSDPGAGDPAASSAHAPGAHAHVAPLHAEYASGAIRLAPDKGLLTGASTVYPLYIDPSYTASGGKLQSWTYVDSHLPSTSYWDTTNSEGLRVGYNGWLAPYYTAESYAKLSVSSQIYGATILSSTFYATETHAPSCTEKTPVELWQTGNISSSTTWNNRPAKKTLLDTKTVAYGWSPDCPAHSVGWNIKSAMQPIANAKTASSITLGLYAGDENDMYGWKKFDPDTMSISTTYDHKPSKPSHLTTSPATSCSSSTPTTVGDGDVALYAKVSDPDGGTLSTTFTATKTTGGAQIASATVTAPSGKSAAYILKKSVLEAAAGGSLLGVSWYVTTSDGTYTSATSATCKFTFDATRPGAPVVTDSAGTECAKSTVAYQVGVPAAFTLSAGSGTAPSSYVYQLNGATPVATSATTISVTPTGGTNALYVTAISSGGNVGDTAVCIITADPAATAAEGDMTGDGAPDLLAVGGQVGLPSGLWLANGDPSGQPAAALTDIGATGTGVNSSGSAADWDGTQAVTGHFNTGAGFNDVLDYNPATGAGTILYGNGDGSPLSPTSGDQVNVASIAFTDDDGHTATSVTTGGGLTRAANGEPAAGRPDLLLISGGKLYDEPASTIPGTFMGLIGTDPLSTTNPAGSGDWTDWTITAALTDGLPGMFARDDASGALYYYSSAELENLLLPAPATPVQIATSGYSAATYPVLQAADLNQDGIPDLRTLTAAGTAVPRLFDGTALTAQPAQALTVPDHAWPLADSDSGAAASAVDTIGALALGNSGTGTTWGEDDVSRGNVLDLDGTGSMSTSAALSMSAPFSLSVWAKPSALGGVVASQDGTANAGFLLYTQTDSQWAFCLATSDTTRNFDCVSGGTALVGQWAHLTAVYDPATQAMDLYVDGRLVARGAHTAVTGFTGAFHLGDDLVNGTRAGRFKGSLSDVEAWNGTALTASQVTALENLEPASAPFTFAGTADYDGNDKADVVAADTHGNLWLYRGNGAGQFFTGALYIGSGFTGYTFAGIADFNGDGYADIVARGPDDTLHLFPGDVAHGLLTPSVAIAGDWSDYTFAGVGDFNSDGKADLVARDAAGVLWLYPGTGTDDVLGTRVQLGTGWSDFTFADVADIDENGYLDIVVRDSSGVLWLYPRSATAWQTRVQLGTGWNNYTFAGISDFNGDGNPDVTARDSNGDLWLYPRTATAFSTRVAIGHSW